MRASALPGILTGGYSQIPNSFIEHQWLLTPAERALYLAIIRRQNSAGWVPVRITAQMFRSWTRLEQRTLEAAIRGLQKKGLMVKGRGDNRTFSMEREGWERFVQSVNPEEYRARTVGRGVDPKKGAKVHPECRERGCAMLEAANLASPSGATPNLQRVVGKSPAACAGSESAAESPAVHAGGLIPFPATPNLQRVVRSVGDGAEQLWSRTLAVLQSLFPLVGVVFLVRLVGIVRLVFADIRDAELAEAVEYAHRSRSRVQRTEGLFLLTVPAAVAALRRNGRGKPTKAQETALKGSGLLDGVQMVIERVTAALRARGAPFEGHVSELVKLRAAVVEGADLEQVDTVMQEIEGRVLATARAELTAGEQAQVSSNVERELRAHNTELWSNIQREGLKGRLVDSATLSVLDIPRLSTFYA